MKTQFALGNLSIHMLISIFVVNGKACDLMFSQFIVYALLLLDMCVCVCVCVFFSINWFVSHACYMPHSMWNDHLWKYVQYQIKEQTIIK
jgi:hypothetical protein